MYRSGSPAPTQSPSCEAQLDRELGAAGPADLEQPVERELGGAQHRAAHEHGVGGVDVAEPPHDLAGLQEILVGELRQLIRGRSHDGFSSALRTDSNYGLVLAMASRTISCAVTTPPAADSGEAERMRPGRPIETASHLGCEHSPRVPSCTGGKEGVNPGSLTKPAHAGEGAAG